MGHVADWRVRETCLTEGTDDLVLEGVMRGSLAFGDVMSTGDTCDYVVHYDSAFEAGLGTMAADGSLARTTIYKVRHVNGDINTTKLSLPAGTKTVIMSTRANKLVRVDRSQSFTSDETAQHRANVPPFESGTRITFQQASAPVGWVKDTDYDDHALRVVSGTPGSGGSVNFSTLHARTATDNFTLSQAHLPSVNLSTTIGAGQGSHNHTPGGAEFYGAGSAFGPAAGGSFFGAPATSTNTLPAMSGTTPLGGSGTAQSAAIDMRVKYVDLILAEAA